LKSGRGFGFEFAPGRLGGAVVAMCYERTAAIGLLLVHHEISGRGHARRLMDAVFADCRRETYLLFATEQGEPLYQKIGFESRDFFVTDRGRLARRHQG